jgi:hypothetical protein
VLLTPRRECHNYRRITLNGGLIDVDDLARIDLSLRLTCQRNHVVPDNADADVVKIFIYKEGRIALVLTQSVAFVTTGLGIEKIPASFSGVADRGLVASHEVIERGIKRKTMCARRK